MNTDIDSRAPPILSVVMPTFNRAELLPKAIASILSQDFEDFELLIVDDGSIDNTATVTKKIQAQDTRLQYLPLSENRGVGFAREAGLRRASGRYIALADSDDIWLPGKLKEQIEVLEKYPNIDILFGDFWNIDYVRGTRARGFSETQAGMKHLRVRELNSDLMLVEGGIETGVLKANFIAAPTMVFRADVVKKIGGYVASLVSGADHEFCWRAAVLGARYAYINRAIIERHRYHSSITANVRTALLQLLTSLEICRQTAELVGRIDLLRSISDSEHRACRNLIREHSDEGERANVWLAYRESLRYGFSPRTLVFFVLGMAGPHVLPFALNLRAQALRLSWRS